MPVRQAGLFGLVGHRRRVVRIPRTISDQYTTACVLAVVTGVYADTLEARDVIQKREQSAELGRAGKLDFVPTFGDGSFGVLGVGDGGRFEGVAKILAVDIEPAESFSGGEGITDKSNEHDDFNLRD